ncbi:MAG: DUF642 domain-containing protein [Chthonomonas sp.]|nr:DUF642 domain-containing protein [Chthonomonas sp.]
MKLAHLAQLCLIAAAPSVRATELLVNGDFESQPNYGSGVAGDSGFSALTGSQIPGWTVEPGHAMTVHNTVLYPTISGNYSLNMDGEGWGGVNGNIYQDFESVDGRWMTLLYQWQRWTTTTTTQFRVTVTDLETNQVVGSLLHTPFGFGHSEIIEFMGNGHTFRLRAEEFPESHYNDNTFIVDNFSVTPYQHITASFEFANTIADFALPRQIDFTLTQGTTTFDSSFVESYNSTFAFTYPQPTLALGPRTLTFDGSSFLKRKFDFTLSGGDVDLGTVLFANGDCDNSGEVDAADIDLIIQEFGEVPTSDLFPPYVDVDASGEVDAADIDVVIANFGAVDD